MEEDVSYYRIAGFDVRMNCSTEFMHRQCASYRIPEEYVYGGKCLDLTYTDEEQEKYKQEGLDLLDFEYAYTFLRFSNEIVDQGAFCFHASAISVDGQGLLFSADSGTGKSTQARLWRKYMTDHEVFPVNDDKPTIRFINEIPYVCGTPWSGKHALNTNVEVPVKALVFLEQSADNSIEEIPAERALSLVLPQILGGKAGQVQIVALMGLLDRFLRRVPIYRLRCTVSRAAVRLVYDTLWDRDEREQGRTRTGKRR